MPPLTPSQNATLSADRLTGLLDRDSFLSSARKLILAGVRGLAVVWFNLDNFKMFNKRFGFEKGDEILKETALILKNIFSQESYGNNLIARFSDDNFVVLTDWASVEITSRERYAQTQGRDIFPF